MGQQQLLLIVLGVIIVGIAVVVGINVFSSSAMDASRDQVVAQLTNLSAKAQQHFRKPTAMGGGNNTFDLFQLGNPDYSNAAGDFYISTTAVSAAAASITGAGSQVASGTNASEIWIVGGNNNQIGNDNTNPVQAVAHVTRDNITTVVLN